jgi:hypothetical protein
MQEQRQNKKIAFKRLIKYQMKTSKSSILTSYCLVILSFFSIGIAQAQEGSPIELEKAKSQLQRDREKIFIEALQLSVSQAAVFHPIYVKFNKEKRTLDDLLISLVINYGKNYQHLNHDLMSEFVKQSEVYQKKELSVRKKYYQLLSEAISIEIGSQFYEVDDFISTNLRLNILSGLPFTGRISEQTMNKERNSN